MFRLIAFARRSFKGHLLVGAANRQKRKMPNMPFFLRNMHFVCQTSYSIKESWFFSTAMIFVIHFIYFSSQYVHWVTKKHIYLTPYVCDERIFDGLQFPLNKILSSKVLITFEAHLITLHLVPFASKSVNCSSPNESLKIRFLLLSVIQSNIVPILLEFIILLCNSIKRTNNPYGKIVTAKMKWINAINRSRSIKHNPFN